MTTKGEAIAVGIAQVKMMRNQCWLRHLGQPRVRACNSNLSFFFLYGFQFATNFIEDLCELLDCPCQRR